MRTRRAVACALVLAASARALAQDAFEPNPSLARLTADDAYARNSAASLREAGFHTAVALRLDDAGRVLVAGVQETYGVGDGLPRVARLDAAGRLDPSFGKCGVAEIPGVRGSAYDLLVDASGRIVVAGSFHDARAFPWRPDSTATTYAAARLLPDGSLDLAFSGDGLLEFDAGARVFFQGPFRASGADGAMLTVATRGGPGGTSQFGLVRVAADGTLDAAYGDGFARLVYDEYGYDEDVDSVTDFAVDSAGRGAVVVRRSDWSRILRVDAAGAPDAPFSGPSAWRDLAPSQVSFDRAGRAVCLDVGRVFRLLPDGAPDRTFSGDGYAWRLDAAGFQGGVQNYLHLSYLIREDPDFRDSDRSERLAVASQADRWVFAQDARYFGGPRAIRVQVIDPADPGAIVLAECRPPEGYSASLVDLAIAPDATAAYALGHAYVVRVDLATRKALPLPDLRVSWLGWPHAVDLGGGRYRVSARVRIRNVARHDAEMVYGYYGVGDVEVVPRADWKPDPERRYVLPFRVRARSSVVKRLTWEGTHRPQLAGTTLSVGFSGQLPDANFDDNVATSLPMTPLYAPR